MRVFNLLHACACACNTTPQKITVTGEDTGFLYLLLYQFFTLLHILEYVYDTNQPQIKCVSRVTCISLAMISQLTRAPSQVHRYHAQD